MASKTETILVGADIGYKDTKLVWLDGGELKSVVIPSMAAADTPFIDTEGAQQGAYRIANTVWTVGADGQSTQYDNFPFSDQARALFHHTLKQAGFNGANIKAATCIPMNMEYKLDGTLNKDNIKKKRENISGICEWLPSGSVEVEAGGVLAEGLAAWIDYLVGFDGQTQSINTYGVVLDIGGNTLDMSTCKGTTLDLSRSDSVYNCGVYRAIDDLKKHLSVKFSGLAFSQSALSTAIREKSIVIFGESHDISREVDSALERTADFIKTQIDTKVGSLHEFGTILCAGGGAPLFYPYLKNHFPNIEMPEHPNLANAVGCLKKLMVAEGVALTDKTTVKEETTATVQKKKVKAEEATS